MKKTSQKNFLIPVLTILSLPRYSAMKTNEMLPDLKAIMHMYPQDKLPFRRTQTKFDKTFHNIITNRDRHFIQDGKELVEFSATSNGFLMTITSEGRRYLKNNR